MSSGAKRRCALGVHCVIAALRAHDHTCDDWTEIQGSDYTQRLTNLLLKAEGASEGREELTTKATTCC